MYKILIDERFYRNTKEQSDYLDDLLLIISLYFDAVIVFFEPFYSQHKSQTLTMQSQIINKKIMKTHKVKKYNLNDVKETTNQELNELGFDKTFINKISYVIQENPDDIIIIPLIYDVNNRLLNFKNIGNYLFLVGIYDGEIESNIAQWIKMDKLIHISNSNFDNQFPAKILCGRYDDWRSEILKQGYTGDKISDFSNIAYEVATRNKYIYDAQLTALNKMKAKPDKNGHRPKRQVFKSVKNDVYLSTDFENGGFEVYDKKAIHQGQYKFNGDFEKDADEHSHPLFLK